ncbi:MAG: pyridoxamine 5'-phosphate oxidase family protein [Rikenellaceae bacterium]|jgi:uncharacterized protein YhbP (UPF0306 family)|nr:pyridoxamine 5'-phosphate oxidase family protein [Rikenellaceae bacterium]
MFGLLRQREVTDEGRIDDFVRRHHVMTLATSSDGLPYCCSVFYAWIATEKSFVFTSDGGTRHVADMEACEFVAGAIALETTIVGRVRGLQLQGVVRRAGGDDLAKARRAYLRRFPYAVAYPLNLWILTPTLLKLTDNRLGFGKKIVWF